MKKEGQKLDLGIIKSIDIPIMPRNWCGGPGCNTNNNNPTQPED